MRADLYKDLYQKENYYWWHVGKRRLITSLIKNYIMNKDLKRKKLKILDVGCGSGKLMEDLKDFGRVSGVDSSKKALTFCKQRGLRNIYRADISDKLPFSEETFDLALLIDVLEHTKDDGKVLRNLKRVLKKNGFLILTIPAYQALFSYWDKMLGHKRRYNKNDLSRKIKKNGYQVLKMSYFNSFVLVPAVFFRLFKSRLSKSKFSSDFVNLPLFLNSLLLYFSDLERKILKFLNIPFGLSIVILAKNE